MTNDLTIRGREDDLIRELERIPAILAGREPDPYGYSVVVAGRVANVVLSDIQEAYIIKARGGMDASGMRWAPLKPETIARRRIGSKTRKKLGISKNTKRGLLSSKQNAKWNAIYRSKLPQAIAMHGPQKGSQLAAQMAWGILKKEGAKTRINDLANRQVEIMRDTDLLFSSLSPGVVDKPGSPPGQVFGINPGGFVIGSNVPYAAAQHAKRRLWPEPKDIPSAWLTRWLGALARGIVQVLPDHLQDVFKGA